MLEKARNLLRFIEEQTLSTMTAETSFGEDLRQIPLIFLRW